MRNPKRVLNSLMAHSIISGYRFERLYRILFNEEMFYIAYQNINTTTGNDRMNIHQIEHLIDALENETYQPLPVSRVYIPKKHGKKHPLGIPSLGDKLVQEVIRMILEAIYEGYFESCSHGFRPDKSYHTALVNIQNSFTGTKWFIEGDIEGFFDNINHEVLINVLKERIDDERFIRLIRKFLNAGYLNDWKFHKTYSGTPQGGIISPILVNIYLDKFDKYMNEYRQSFKESGKGKRGMEYVRYADDFLVGIIGSKEDCKTVKKDIRNYLKSYLKLELSEEKTLITNTKKPAKFLGYDIFLRKTNGTKKDLFGTSIRIPDYKVVLRVTTETMRKKLMDYNAVEFDYSKGKETWKPKARSYMKNNGLVDILTQYNAEIREFCNYYSIACNSSSTKFFLYIMKYSMYKTFAYKLQISVNKVLKKYSKNKKFAVPYTDSKGQTKYRAFDYRDFKRTTNQVEVHGKH